MFVPKELIITYRCIEHTYIGHTIKERFEDQNQMSYISAVAFYLMQKNKAFANDKFEAFMDLQPKDCRTLPLVFDAF